MVGFIFFKRSLVIWDWHFLQYVPIPSLVVPHLLNSSLFFSVLHFLHFFIILSFLKYPYTFANLRVSCYFTDHSESLDLTINFSSSTFDSGQRKATVLVASLYLGLAPDPCRVPPLFSFLFFIYKVAIIVFKFIPSYVCHILNSILLFIFFDYSCLTKK